MRNNVIHDVMILNQNSEAPSISLINNKLLKILPVSKDLLKLTLSVNKINLISQIKIVRHRKSRANLTQIRPNLPNQITNS